MPVIQNFIDYFKLLYTDFRRSYFSYVHNLGIKQYFVFANVAFKVAPQEVPYYFTATAAAESNLPDGYFPANLSTYYLQELPVIIFDSNLQNAISAGNSFNLQKGNAVATANIYLSNDYRQVYFLLDPASQQIDLHYADQEKFAEMGNNVAPVNVKVQQTVNNLVSCHNSKIALLESNPTPAAVAQANQAANAIAALRTIPDLLTKVSLQCNNSKKLDVLGSVLFASYDKLSTDPTARQAIIDKLKSIEESCNAIPSVVPVLPAGTQKKDNTLLIAACIVGGALLLSNGKE